MRAYSEEEVDRHHAGEVGWSQGRGYAISLHLFKAQHVCEGLLKGEFSRLFSCLGQKSRERLSSGFTSIVH